MDSGYGGSERNRALEPQSQPANEQQQRRQRRERSRGNFLKIQYIHRHTVPKITFLSKKSIRFFFLGLLDILTILASLAILGF